MGSAADADPHTVTSEADPKIAAARHRGFARLHLRQARDI